MATDYFLIPRDRDSDYKEIFESTLRLLCSIGDAVYEKMADGVYNIESRTEDETGFGIDWVEDVPYDWHEDFDIKTETPVGPEYVVRTHASSIPFAQNFLKLLIMELDKRKLYFRVYDPQNSRFIV